MRLSFLRLCVPVLLAFGLAPGITKAAPVISEVLWAGSDLSSSDEWLEIIGLDAPTVLTGHTVTGVNSAGTEVVLARFPDGLILGPGQHLIVSHFGAAQSRLLTEPTIISNDVSLPNTKLLLRIRDAAGVILDEVDDGVGSPFAGASASDKKISMERADLRKAGTDPANWISATQRMGLDDGTIVLATPGFYGGNALNPTEPLPEPKSSSSSTQSASNSQAASCPDPRIVVQSGTTSGIEKVTLNIQVVTDGKSLASGACQVLFGDGERSDSCNPPSHSYEEPGTYALRAILQNYCGTTVERVLSISVSPKPNSSSRASSSFSEEADPTLAVFNAASFSISAMLPNPSGKNPEWIEVTNTRGQVGDLEGWKLVLPLSGRSFTFGSVPFGVGETKRFLASELQLMFPNDGGRLELWNDRKELLSTITWQKPAVDEVIPGDIGDISSVFGTVTYVIDGTTFDLRMDPASVGKGIRPVERVRLLGVHVPESDTSHEQKSAMNSRLQNFVSALIQNKKIELQFDSLKRDTQGRLLAYVLTDDGFILQNVLLSRGLVSVGEESSVSRYDEFLLAEAEAKETFAGIWSIQEEDIEVAATQESSRSASSLSRIPILSFLNPLDVHIPASSSPRSSASSAKKRAVNIAKFTKTISVTTQSSAASIQTLQESGSMMSEIQELSLESSRGDSSTDSPSIPPVFFIGVLLALVGFGGSVFLSRKG
jgi:endonuclease YncB( thermonuclease family)